MRGRRNLTVADALADKTFIRDPETGCWNWNHGTNGGGYGTVKINGTGYLVHRLIAELRYGRKLQPGEVVMHLCDNPSCIYPFHLVIGTQADNMYDLYVKDRWRNQHSPKPSA